MKLRSFVPLAATLAALAACESNPVATIDPALTGTWISNEETIESPFPTGTKTVKSRITVIFRENGTFNRAQLSFDPAQPSSIVDLLEEGTFSVRDGRIFAHVRRAYRRVAAAPVPNPTPQSVDEDSEYAYTFDGPVLRLVPVCPANALCAPPRFTSYQRSLPD